jgi:hypothetical protein
MKSEVFVVQAGENWFEARVSATETENARGLVSKRGDFLYHSTKMSEVGREQQVRVWGAEETSWQPITALLKIFSPFASAFSSL